MLLPCALLVGNFLTGITDLCFETFDTGTLITLVMFFPPFAILDELGYNIFKGRALFERVGILFFLNSFNINISPSFYSQREVKKKRGRKMIIDSKIFKLAKDAKSGCISSKIELARLYSVGQAGIPVSLEKSLEIWLDLAQRLGELRKERFNTSELFLHIGNAYLEKGNKQLAKGYFMQAAEEIIYAYEFHEWNQALKKLDLINLLSRTGYKWRSAIEEYL